VGSKSHKHRLKRRIRTIGILSWQQRRILLCACVLLNAIRLSLWLLPFGKVRKYLSKFSLAWGKLTSQAEVSVGLITWCVETASNNAPGGALCLAKALTTQILLNRYGYAHKFCIGVNKSSKQTLKAHAWIEHEGQVIMGNLNDLKQYKPLTQ